MARYTIGRILPIFQGEWQNNHSYDRLDIVLKDTISYVSLIDNNSTTPNENSANWQVVCRGATTAEVIEAISGGQLQIGRLDVEDDLTATDISASNSIKVNGEDVATMPLLEKIAGGNIGTMLQYKKITSSGTVESASTATNRTLEVDVEDYNGQDFTISGINYAKTGAGTTYCWYTIHDEYGNVLEKSAINNTTSVVRHIDEKITIPNGAKTLYVQGSAVDGSILPSAQAYPYIRDIIDEHTEEINKSLVIKSDNIVNSPDRTVNYLISNSDGTWHSLNTVGSYIFNVLEGERYEIHAPDDYNSYCSLLSTLNIVVGEVPNYMSGTEKVQINKRTTMTIEVPQNGYMVISCNFYHAGTKEYLPSAIYRVSYVKDVVIENEREIEQLKEEIAGSSIAPIKYSMISQKKITSEGVVTTATTATNRTLKADVTGYVDKTLYLDGTLYKKTSETNNYCWYVFQDENGNVVEKSISDSSASVRYTNEPIVVPNGAVTLYVQGSESALPKAQADISSVVGELMNSDLGDLAEKSIRTFPLAFSSLSTVTGRPATNSSYTNDACKHTIDYIKVHKTIQLKNLQSTTIVIRIWFYDKDCTMISMSPTYQDTINGLDNIIVSGIPSDAVWFRVSLHTDNTNYPNRVKYPRFELEIESEWSDGADTIKEPYVEYCPFVYAVKTNIPIKIYDHSYTTKSVFGYDEGLIHLPPTYTNNGKPTPLIFFIHGDAERYTIGESSFSGHMKMQQCWSDAGFAQADLDLIPSYLNTPSLASTGGSRDDLECISAAWEWITTHFNIDKTGFYLIGRSRGGQCVLEVLGKGGAIKLPIIAAISMAGANSIFEYSVYSNATENEWQLWCNAHGLPTEGRPSWANSPVYSTSKSFLSDTNIYNFVSDNFELWSKKAFTGWGLVTKNTDNITPRNYFDNFIYPFVQANRTTTTATEQFFIQMLNTMEAKSPIPLRFDWCVGDTTQNKLPYTAGNHSYSSMFTEMVLNTPASKAEYRRWDGVDETNPYDETNPHYAENMIFYDGDLVLPNGAVTSNPSKVTMEWLIWCMGKDPRYQGTEYSLPWQ